MMDNQDAQIQLLESASRRNASYGDFHFGGKKKGKEMNNLLLPTWSYTEDKLITFKTLSFYKRIKSR